MEILRGIINIPQLVVVCEEFGNEFQVNSKWARPSCIPTDLGEFFNGECLGAQKTNNNNHLWRVERETAWHGQSGHVPSSPAPAHSSARPPSPGPPGQDGWKHSVTEDWSQCAHHSEWHRWGNYAIIQQWNHIPGNIQIFCDYVSCVTQSHRGVGGQLWRDEIHVGVIKRYISVI